MDHTGQGPQAVLDWGAPSLLCFSPVPCFSFTLPPLCQTPQRSRWAAVGAGQSSKGPTGQRQGPRREGEGGQRLKAVLVCALLTTPLVLSEGVKIPGLSGSRHSLLPLHPYLPRIFQAPIMQPSGLSLRKEKKGPIWHVAPTHQTISELTALSDFLPQDRVLKSPGFEHQNRGRRGAGQGSPVMDTNSWAFPMIGI